MPKDEFAEMDYFLNGKSLVEQAKEIGKNEIDKPLITGLWETPQKTYTKTELFSFADYCMTHNSGFTSHETESKFRNWLDEKFNTNPETFKKEMFGDFDNTEIK